MRLMPLAALAAFAAFSPVVEAADPDPKAPDPKVKALGAHLSRECTSCHRIDGVDNGIPSIVALEQDYFVQTLKFYRDGLRPNPAMRSVAESLDDAQMLALAVFFGSLEKAAPQRAADTKAKKK